MSKYIIPILFTFIVMPIVGFSQISKIPIIEFNRKIEHTNSYTSLLNIKDTNALIVKIAYAGFWLKGENAKYIVYYNTGCVRKFTSFQPSDSSLKMTVDKINVKKIHYQYYWNFLNDCVKKNSFSINERNLNITTKEDLEKGSIVTLSISDGTDYIFGLYQNNQITEYNSYMPETYIKQGYPGAADRQKLLNLINGITDLMKKYE